MKNKNLQDETPNKKAKIENEKVALIRDGNLISKKIMVDVEIEDETIPIVDKHIVDSESKVADAVFQA